MTEMQKAGCNLFLGSSITAIKKEDDDTFTVTLDGIHTCRPGKATKSAKDAGEPQFVHPRPHADAEENKDYSADSEFIRGGFDCVLYAIGRAPNTRTLNLEAAGIEAEKSGAIKVDKVSGAQTPWSVLRLRNSVMPSPSLFVDPSVPFDHQPPSVCHWRCHWKAGFDSCGDCSWTFAG